ncbi:MAG TPA: NifU family protein [Lacipirellulaceae bacterium]
MEKNTDIERRLERVELLIGETEEHADPAMRRQIQEIVRGLLDYYGAGLERILDLAEQGGGSDLLQSIAKDELVSSLLMLHGLHPINLPTRVEQALDSVRPYLQSHGGEVELVDASDGAVQLRLHGSCHGCPSSAITMKTKIEQAIYEAAPDVTRVDVEEPANGATAMSTGAFVPLATLTHANGA